MEGNKDIPVFFNFGRGEKLPPQNDKYILVSVATRSWNDFGFETHSEYALFDGEKKLASGDIYLAFLERKGDSVRSQSDLDDLIGSYEGLVSSEKLPLAISMHMDMQAYRRLVFSLGVELSGKVLLSLNDMAYLRAKEPNSDSFVFGAKSLVFHQSFLRNSDSFFAYHNAASILDGLEYESFESTSKGIRLKFNLPGFLNEHELFFNFHGNEIFSNRVCVLIGKNGTGKSRALYNIARAAISGDHNRLSDPSGKRLMVNRVVAVSTPGETENTYPRYRKKSVTPYVKISLRRRGRSDQAGGMGEALVRLARSQESIRDESRWAIFKALVKEIAPLSEIAVRTIDLDSRMGGGSSYVTLDKISLSRGEQRWLEVLGAIDRDSGFYHFLDESAYPFSSGQITFLRFVCQLCLYIENGALVLLDEPETHLHPNLVVKFYQLLDKLLERTGSLAIIATHSPYFVREVPSSQVVFLREEESGYIVSSAPRLRTLGADISAISFFIFGDDNKSVVARNIKERIISQGLSPDYVKKVMGRELSSEMISYLSRELEIDSEELI